MLRIDVKFKNKNSFNSLMRYISQMDSGNNPVWFDLQNELNILADASIQDMKDRINSMRKRPSDGEHTLENSITKEEVGSQMMRFEVGVGNIDTLKLQAPYFEVLDAGGYVPPVNLGYFGDGNPPIPGKNGEMWTHTGNRKDYLLKPTKAIEGVEYVAYAARNLEKNMDEMIARIGSQIISKMENI